MTPGGTSVEYRTGTAVWPAPAEMPRARTHPRARTAAFWQLPHLLGLDAPLVALGWQLWWAQSLGVHLRWTQHCVLALAVWMIYLADRLADACALRPDNEAEGISERHRFAWRHRQPLAWLLGFVVGALVLLTPLWLTTREFAAGCTLLVVQAAYFGWTHLRGNSGDPDVTGPGLWRKEAWVGGSFATGTIWFSAWSAGGNLSSGVVTALLGFGVVCFLNCALISHWERPAPPGDRTGARLGATCAIVAGLAAICGPILGGPFWPLALAAAGLWWVDRMRSRLSRETCRILADVVLLTPFLLLSR